MAEQTDLVVLGAGAAGLMAAIHAAERGARVVVLEKNRRPGVKILMSGGTRCNLTNARGLHDLRCVSGPIDPAYDPRQAQGARAIQAAFGADGGRFLGPALRAFGAERTVQFFESEGVATKVEGNGKVFPVSDKAVDVLNALTRRLERAGAALRCQCAALGVEAAESGFLVRTSAGDLNTTRVVLAVGGQSYPGCGTTGDGYAIARAFGHGIVEPRPALVPLRVEADWVAGLKGLTVPDVMASVHTQNGQTLLARREALLFAHFGLTGPSILDVSRAVARHEGPAQLDLVLDFAPDWKLDALDKALQTSSREGGRKAVSGLLPVDLPRRLVEAVLAAADVPADRTGPELSREERKRFVTALKGLRLRVTGTLGFAKAEVTSGGIALSEVDPRTLESRRQPGLHFVGEVLDLDGLIGGYNFQAAWSTGWLVGETATQSSSGSRVGVPMSGA